MTQATYQVTLSLDGNHSVSVSGDDPEAVKTGLAWAKRVYDQLVARSSSQLCSSTENRPTAITESRPTHVSP